jgi:hypothetical protein
MWRSIAAQSLQKISGPVIIKGYNVEKDLQYDVKIQ